MYPTSPEELPKEVYESVYSELDPPVARYLYRYESLAKHIPLRRTSKLLALETHDARCTTIAPYQACNSWQEPHYRAPSYAQSSWGGRNYQWGGSQYDPWDDDEYYRSRSRSFLAIEDRKAADADRKTDADFQADRIAPQKASMLAPRPRLPKPGAPAADTIAEATPPQTKRETAEADPPETEQEIVEAEPPKTELGKLEPPKAVPPTAPDGKRKASVDIEEVAFQALVEKKRVNGAKRRRLRGKQPVNKGKGRRGKPPTKKANAKGKGGKVKAELKVGKAKKELKVGKVKAELEVDETNVVKLDDFEYTYPEGEEATYNAFCCRYYDRAKRRLQKMDITPGQMKVTLTKVSARAGKLWKENQ